MSEMLQEINSVPEGIFRKYDIRGEVDHELTPANVFQIAKAIGTKMRLAGETAVIVGRDGRLSGPVLSQALQKGLMSMGLEVIDIGMVPSPVLYFATQILKTRSGVMLTGSHNPPKYNGLKILIAGETLSGDEIHSIYKILESGKFFKTYSRALKNQNDINDLGDLEKQSFGAWVSEDVREAYVQRIAGEVKLAKKLKVVVDSGNGVTGELGPKVLKALGCEIVELFTDIDGTFPNHHPDPLKPENLQDLIRAVKSHKADIGLAFDGDGDRVGVVSNQGNIIWADRVMMLLASGVLKNHPGATILFDVKCTKFLADVIKLEGGKPVMSATGHSIMKANLKKSGAELGGELSGHIFYKERWYGFDDGIYAGMRLLELVSEDSRTVDEIFKSYPEGVSTPELNILVTEVEKFKIVDTLVSQASRYSKFQDAALITLDGIRIEFPRGWALIRASNTTPNLVLRFEALTVQDLSDIQAIVRDFMREYTPQVVVDF
jgi:phosphomannomutase/phosphoglucomutase